MVNSSLSKEASVFNVAGSIALKIFSENSNSKKTHWLNQNVDENVHYVNMTDGY